MKKTFSLTLLSLFLMFFMLISIGGVGVSAYTYNPDEDGRDFTPYKNEIVYCQFTYFSSVSEDGTVLMCIYDISIETGDFEEFQFYRYTDFSPEIEARMYVGRPGTYLRDYFNVSGCYWNPWLQYWQLEYPVEPNITAIDWYNHISQFDFGFAYGEIDDNGDILIVEEPGHEYEGYWIEYSGDVDWFEPELDIIEDLVCDDEGVVWYLEQNFEDFDGYLYWNFEQGYWQIEYYETSELDYYMQRVDDLEDEISLLEDEIQDLENEIELLEDEIQDLEDEIQDLENEIELLEDEIQDLEDEIQDLENEIQQLEEALDFEYERGFDEGYEIGYSEGLLVENNDITKWFVPLIVIIIVVGIIEPIIILKRRG